MRTGGKIPDRARGGLTRAAHRSAIGAGAIASALTSVLAGCGGGGTRAGALDPAAFRAGPQQPPTVATIAERPPRPTFVTRTDPTPAPVDITVRAGDPQTSTDATPTGAPVLMGSKIGDINSHPIWASEFFDQNLSARLRANALKMSRQDWIDNTRAIVRERLQTQMDDILMKDEGLATLTPEMKQYGLSAVLNQYKENLKSRNMGSESLANDAARQNQTQYYDSLDAQAREFEEKLLIGLMTDKLDRSINISAAAVRRFYYANPDLFDPPPVAVFSMIVISRNRLDDADAVRWALDSGALFADLASQPINVYKPDQAGRMPEQTFTGDYAQADLFARPAMAAAARTLHPGEWTGPFDDGSGNLAFLRLDRIIKTTVSLYDAQLAIDSLLHNTEFLTRMRQRIDRLKSRSSLTDQGEMERRLMEYAEAKFLPSGS